MKYFTYFLKKLGLMLITMLIVSFIVFMLIRASGRNPLVTLLGNKTASEDVKAETMARFNLDKPLVVQYGIWLNDVLKGDWGISYSTKQPVSVAISQRLPVTLGLVFLSILIALLIAIPLGTICAVFKNSWIDHVVSTIMLICTSTPSFLMALVFLLITPVVFPSYPLSGTIDGTASYFQRLILPAIVLALFMVALLARVLKSSMIEQLKSSYVMVAKGKGMSTKAILLKHVMKNSIIPMITILSAMIGSGIGGAVLVEQIFTLPGVGSLLLDAINAGNYPVIQAVVMITLFIYLLSSIIVDFLYAVIDPRVQLK